MKLVISIVGVTLALIGGYYAFKAGYHLLYYDVTFGLEPGKFGHGRPYWQIIFEFTLWITVIIGGIGLLTYKRTGIKIGLYSLILPTILSLIFFVAELSKKSDYSTTMLVNTERREMTLYEQWKYIYSEPTLLFLVTSALIFVIFVIRKQLKRLT